MPSLCRARDGTKGFVLTRHPLCLLNYTPTPFLLGLEFLFYLFNFSVYGQNPPYGFLGWNSGHQAPWSEPSYQALGPAYSILLPQPLKGCH